MKLKDAFKKYPELLIMMKDINPRYYKPNTLCSTILKELEKINTDPEPVTFEGLKRSNVDQSYLWNRNSREIDIGFYFDMLRDNIKQYIPKIPKTATSKRIYMEKSFYNHTIVHVYEDVESTKEYNERMKVLAVLNFFKDFILKDINEYESTKEQSKIDKAAKEKEFQRELKLLKTKFGKTT